MKERVAASFSASASNYDTAADVQQMAAQRLARRIAAALPAAPQRILEIGCGTGLLSTQLAALYPQSELVLTDISATMLGIVRERLGTRASYKCMDGETPDPVLGSFDLIASSFAMQWFIDLRGAIARLTNILQPGGNFSFATLGAESFAEWRAAHSALNLRSGLHAYPSAKSFPWPESLFHTLETELIKVHYPDGRAFIHSLKTIGAAQPIPTHRPLSPAQLGRVLKYFRSGCTASYQIFYGDLRKF